MEAEIEKRVGEIEAALSTIPVIIERMEQNQNQLLAILGLQIQQGENGAFNAVLLNGKGYKGFITRLIMELEAIKKRLPEPSIIVAPSLAGIK